MGSRKKWRVYQFLSAMGAVRSKHEAAMLARSGKLLVDGKKMESLHYQIDPRKQHITLNGKQIELAENRKYFVLNKPLGIECTKEDILSLFSLPSSLKNSLSPAGRLDKETTGLLIVTNDGRLIRRVLDPLTKRAKKYRAIVRERVTETEAERLRNGIIITLEENGISHEHMTLPAKITIVKTDARQSTLDIQIIEGKKRQIRHMCGMIGHPIISLHRYAIANLELPSLAPGKYQEYTKQEMYKLLFE